MAIGSRIPDLEGLLRVGRACTSAGLYEDAQKVLTDAEKRISGEIGGLFNDISLLAGKNSIFQEGSAPYNKIGGAILKLGVVLEYFTDLRHETVSLIAYNLVSEADSISEGGEIERAISFYKDTKQYAEKNGLHGIVTNCVAQIEALEKYTPEQRIILMYQAGIKHLETANQQMRNTTFFYEQAIRELRAAQRKIGTVLESGVLPIALESKAYDDYTKAIQSLMMLSAGIEAHRKEMS